MRRPLFLLGFLLVASTALGQAPSTDSQTLQALLTEVRQLRQELQSNSAAAQRTQILFFRLQTQQTAVARASQRVDDARAKLAETQATRKNLEGEAKRAQDSLEHVDNVAERKSQEDMIRYFKRRIEASGEEEQQRLAKQIEVEDLLRIEQAKLDEFQARLDELDKTLQKSAHGATSNP
jgi:hypothetical protein